MIQINIDQFETKTLLTNHLFGWKKNKISFHLKLNVFFSSFYLRNYIIKRQNYWIEIGTIDCCPSSRPIDGFQLRTEIRNALWQLAALGHPDIIIKEEADLKKIKFSDQISKFINSIFFLIMKREKKFHYKLRFFFVDWIGWENRKLII